MGAQFPGVIELRDLLSVGPYISSDWTPITKNSLKTDLSFVLFSSPLFLEDSSGL